jgi:hypothetical protein
MSIYSELSLKVGWDWLKTENLPAPEIAESLLILVRDKHDVNSFEQVFKLYRFAKSPCNANEAKSNALICEAFSAGRQIFS